MYPYNGSIPDVFIDDEDVGHNIDEYDNDDDDERSAADYGMIGVLDCSVINCPNSNVFIDDEYVEYNIDDCNEDDDVDDDDNKSSADYGIIGVLECSVINCPLFPPAPAARLRTATHAQL